MAITAPKPYDFETQHEFIVRAHRELMAAVPEAGERNQVIWDAWDASRGNVERQQADRDFTPDKFTKRESVCYFPEHETSAVGPDGAAIVRRYDVTRLAQIADENNNRIRERRAYPTLVDKHTLPKEELKGGRDPDPPKTLGAVGPLRIGMIGRDQPVFSLFADEYARKDAAATLADRPGRSVEVLTLRANGRSYINPIAAISEAPRLPIPLQFSADASGDTIAEYYWVHGDDGMHVDRYSEHSSDDVIVDRYSVMTSAPASPAGSNTYVQRFGTGPGQSDGPQVAPAEGSNPEQETPTMALSDEDVRQVVDAILSTPPMQWAMQQMNQQGGPAVAGSGDGAGAPSGQPAPGGPPSPSPGGPPPAIRDRNMAGMPGQGGAVPMRYSAENGDEESLVERYNALASSQHELITELADATGRLVSLERERSDAVRYSALQELHSRFPHFVDLDEEKSRCLYSAGGNMDDDEFDDHVTLVEQYAARTTQVSPMIPSGESPERPGKDADVVRYAAQEATMIRDLSAQYVNRGEVRSYDELRTEAREKLKAGAA